MIHDNSKERMMMFCERDAQNNRCMEWLRGDGHRHGVHQISKVLMKDPPVSISTVTNRNTADCHSPGNGSNTVLIVAKLCEQLHLPMFRSLEHAVSCMSAR